MQIEMVIRHAALCEVSQLIQMIWISTVLYTRKESCVLVILEQQHLLSFHRCWVCFSFTLSRSPQHHFVNVQWLFCCAIIIIFFLLWTWMMWCTLTFKLLFFISTTDKALLYDSWKCLSLTRLHRLRGLTWTNEDHAKGKLKSTTSQLLRHRNSSPLLQSQAGSQSPASPHWTEIN